MSTLPPSSACSAFAPPGKSRISTSRPSCLEVAVALGDRQRQVVEQRLAADADGELRLFEPLRARGRGGQQHRKRESNQFRHATHRSSPEVTRKEARAIVGGEPCMPSNGEHADASAPRCMRRRTPATSRSALAGDRDDATGARAAQRLQMLRDRRADRDHRFAPHGARPASVARRRTRAVTSSLCRIAFAKNAWPNDDGASPPLQSPRAHVGRATRRSPPCRRPSAHRSTRPHSTSTRR